jgi:uncharacterized protein DUF6599
MTRTLVLLLLCACGSHERARHRSAPPPDEGAAPPAGPPARFEGVGQLLPHPTLATWHQSGEVRYFDAQNLYTYMDGASDSFLEYGFAHLATTEYVPEATAGGSPRTVTVEVFDMATLDGAFGKWSRIAGEEGDPAALAARIVPIGGGALQGGGDLTFWKGQHLVKLTYLDQDPNATEEGMRAASRDVLGRMARAIADGLPGATEPPAEMRQLPSEGLIAWSPVFFARNVLGREGLGPGWRAWYDRGGKRILLVRARRAAFDAMKSTPGAARVSGLGDEAVRLHDDLGGDVVLARKGDLAVWAGDPDLPDLPKADEAAKIDLVRAALGG